MQFEPQDLATLRSIVAELESASVTAHAIGPDDAHQPRAAIGTSERARAIVKVAHFATGMGGLAAKRTFTITDEQTVAARSRAFLA
jgi:hypothetical protein